MTIKEDDDKEHDDKEDDDKEDDDKEDDDKEDDDLFFSVGQVFFLFSEMLTLEYNL